MLSTQGGARLGEEEALVAQRVKNLPVVQETWVQSLGQEDPLVLDTSLDEVYFALQ